MSCLAWHKFDYFIYLFILNFAEGSDQKALYIYYFSGPFDYITKFRLLCFGGRFHTDEYGVPYLAKKHVIKFSLICLYA